MTAQFEFYNGTHRVHGRCEGACPLHSPSDHAMRDWPMEWRPYMNMAVRLCPHGIEHPDPDSVRWVHGGDLCTDTDCLYRVHNCDGCCRPYIPVDEILADLIAIAESINGKQPSY